MAGNTLTLEFAGDATKLQRAAQQAMGATESVARSARDAGGAFDDSGQAASRYESRMGDLGSATTGLIDSVDSLGGGLQALADIQDSARAQAQRLARAAFDVADAQENMRQATRDAAAAQNDGKRAALDMETALLDQKDAQKEYNKAVKEHGKGSDEAKRALIDVKSAGLDYAEAQEDANQAVRDGARANLDAKEAQLNLNDAMKEANPPDIQQWADKIALVTPLLTALIGVTSLITTAQWLWNAAQLASPTTWVVLGIVALIAVIVLIATKTTWFQDMWKAAWGWIKSAASAVGSWFKDTLWGKWIKGAWDGILGAGKRAWEWMKELPGKLKNAFVKIGEYVSRPFRAGFNAISDAWNNTVGRLWWQVPGWVPGIGGNSVGAPQLPKFHTGGVIPGMPGQEVPIMALAGEEIRPRGSGGSDSVQVVVKLDGEVLLEAIAKAVRRRGGGTQFVLGVGHG